MVERSQVSRPNVREAVAAFASLLRALCLRNLALSDSSADGVAEAIDGLLEAAAQEPIDEGLGRLLAFLTDWSEAHEARHLPQVFTTQAELLRHLMDTNGLRQSDLAQDLGGQSVVSQILNGRRALNASHIGRLAQRFGLGTDVFYAAMAPAELLRPVALHLPARGTALDVLELSRAGANVGAALRAEHGAMADALYPGENVRTPRTRSTALLLDRVQLRARKVRRTQVPTGTSSRISFIQ